MDSLTEDLKKELKRHRLLAKCNYLAAYWISTAVVIVSVVAGLSVGSDWFTKEVRTVLSALPGAMLILFERLKFEERSDWHYRRTYALRSLLHKLKYCGRPEAEVSQEWLDMITSMEREWPKFGRAPQKP